MTANSAEEALGLPLMEYGLILLDVMKGEMSGFQMARRLKERPETAGIAIIFITALDGEDNTVKGFNIGLTIKFTLSAFCLSAGGAE